MNTAPRKASGALLALLLVAATAAADANRTYDVTITNVTSGQVFSPPVLVTHSTDVALFELGAPALEQLALVAEDGAGQPLADLASTLPAVIEAQATSAPIPPGGSAAYAVNGGKGSDVLSIVGMLVNTNDAFFALDSGAFPQSSGGSLTFHVAAYDAGSEANNEDCAYIPGPACPMGSGNARSPGDAEGFVHVHDGIHGIADLATAEYDWRNPVAKITVTRTN